ncbi:MAG: hypothetical protein R3F19_16880 [Verrucomicrobiales bacterium]
MRKLPPRPQPSEALAANLAVWARQWDELKARNPDAEFRWNTKDQRSAREWILDELLRWSANHCAFCDGMGGTTNWPVEHFKPKSHYPEDGYAWENLYPCCEQCQGKGAEYDDDLMRPDEEDYAFARYFWFDFTAPDGVALLPIAKSVVERTRAERLIKLYRLDDRKRRQAREREWHIWDPPPHDDPTAWADASPTDLAHWELAQQHRDLQIARWKSGHLSIEDRPYRDLVEEVLEKLTASSSNVECGDGV